MGLEYRVPSKLLQSANIVPRATTSQTKGHVYPLVLRDPMVLQVYVSPVQLGARHVTVKVVHLAPQVTTLTVQSV